MMNYSNSNKVHIIPDKRDPLWLEIERRFKKEVTAPPDTTASDTQNFYYKATRGRLKVTDFDWYLLDNQMILRERKKSVG